MSQADQDRRIDYVEFPSTNIEETKRFYSTLFGWTFTDYGPEYTSFTDGRLNGGFAAAREVEGGGPLIVLTRSRDRLDAAFALVEEAGRTSCGDCMPYENGIPIHIARGPRLPADELWAQVKHYD